MNEKLFELESQLSKAVSSGNKKEIKEILSSFQFGDEYTEDYKYFLIGLNAVLRKTAENSGVPISLLISAANTNNEKIALLSKADTSVLKDIAEGYCILVEESSTAGYSESVKRTIIKINSDLCADISLSALAKYNNMSVGYLSGLFKKETGLTLIDYVNRQRVNKAKLLLRTTHLKIGEISKLCGVEELNYFAKLFKRYENLSPTEYRNRK